MKFDEHVNNLCKKVCQKLNAPVRLAPFMNVDKKRMIMKAFIDSQFGHCPLVWMFHSRSLNSFMTGTVIRYRKQPIHLQSKPMDWFLYDYGLRHDRVNNKINWIHERALKITYNDKSSSFQNLLEKDNSVTIHHRNIKILATETYKFLQGLSPPLMNETFVEKNNNYNLWRNNVLNRRGTETVSFLAPKIWDILPKDIKDSESLDIFKSKIKKWISLKCPLRNTLADFVKHMYRK